MKFKYLGTAAAEGWPAVFCECDNCKRALIAGGKNLRTRSQAIIDDKLLIDFPPDTYLHVLYFGLDLTKVNTVIITHNHSDHLYEEDFGMRRVGFAHTNSNSNLTVYGTKPTGERVTKVIKSAKLDNQDRVIFQEITPFVTFEAEGYYITPLKANHSLGCNPVFFCIDDNEKKILYANDTGYFPDETWEYLKQNQPYFNFVSLDCTTGIKHCRNGHMGLDSDVEVKNRLLEIGCADDNTIFCVHHFSHNGIAIYDEIEPKAKKLGFLTSYDGMCIEI